MKIKRIIMFAAAVVVSFGGTFAFVRLKSKAPETAQALDQSSQKAAAETLPGLPLIVPGLAEAPTTSSQNLQKTLTQKQLKDLIYEIQGKKRQYNKKAQDQALQQQRLQMAADMLKKDSENLNELRIELASTVAQLKQQQLALEQTRVQIENDEQANLKSIATTFDRMDSASAGNIMINMCRNNQSDDAVKIIYYMSERTSAKLLAELSSADPKLAPGLCDKLKRIKQSTGTQTP